MTNQLMTNRGGYFGSESCLLETRVDAAAEPTEAAPFIYAATATSLISEGPLLVLIQRIHFAISMRLKWKA